MEYTRFPRAADEPPRADALRGLIEASSPPGQGRLRQRYIARRKSGFLFQGVSHIPFASSRLSFTTVCFTILVHPVQFHNVLAYLELLDIPSLVVRSTTPLIGTEGGDSSGNSTCLGTPQYFKEGRLKPFCANNVDIPFARARQVKCATSCRTTCTSTSCARRLKPCPRQSRHCESGLLEQMSTLYCYKVKASACSGNQRFLTLIRIVRLYILTINEERTSGTLH